MNKIITSLPSRIAQYIGESGPVQSLNPELSARINPCRRPHDPFFRRVFARPSRAKPLRFSLTGSAGRIRLSGRKLMFVPAIAVFPLREMQP
jgi:hypothetical protein